MATTLLDDGPFTWRTAAARGVSERELRALCEAGALERPSRGLYVPAHLADDPAARAAAIALVLPRGAALARESAAWLMGIDVRPPGRWERPPLLECLVPLGGVRPHRADLSAYISDLPEDDVVRIDGVACTSPTRTALDLARYRPRYIGLGAVDALTHAGLVSVHELEEAVRPLRGRRFVRRAREVIELCDPRAESMGESWGRLRVVEAGLPRPEVQISLRDESGREVFRLDMGIVEEQIGIEYDGVAHHLRTPAQREHDDARRTAIRDRFGWRVVVTTKEDVLGTRPVLESTLMEMLGLSIEFRRRLWI
ncbi:type IV toxin-antitoxin system AbiEi family antitoxin domain-containing protein [Georgenia satyanarayanai]|uniref:type IV toxin-antitoxin system AbiEi family antitoxin domain-containing protein n=1 Tax=Georgenia satyanarayanai TaxID=860221 RepID=UPI001264ECD7|nr:type IV toxin-antitoxin system AbiEi family antitoxin domain-containing protein [Georgenia satyanarayanai]